MICPICGEHTKVIDSKDYDNGCGVKRRRKCLVCNYRFNTIELDEDMTNIDNHKEEEE